MRGIPISRWNISEFNNKGNESQIDLSIYQLGMFSMFRVRNFLRIINNFDKSSKCFQMIQEDVVYGAAGVLFFVFISMWFLKFCWTLDLFPHSEHMMESSLWIMIFHFFVLSWILWGTQSNCASCYLLHIFPVFIKVLLAGKCFITKFTHPSFQILFSKYLMNLSNHSSLQAFLFCLVLELSLTWNSVELNTYCTYTLCAYIVVKHWEWKGYQCWSKHCVCSLHVAPNFFVS